MKYLLDVNALLAGIIANHPQHGVAARWLKNKAVATCPISELGFLRISTHPKAYALSMQLAREALQAFISTHKAEFFPADMPALGSASARSDEVTDMYMAELAGRKKLKLATFDSGIDHPAAELIA